MVDGQTLEEKIAEQVEKYDGGPFEHRERMHYRVYEIVLRRILEKACRKCEVLGFVEARAKATASFAEKITRKGQQLEDPVTQFTDLCGARVITQTKDEVERICRFVRRHFKIDEGNSPDVRSRLAVGEFGYLSDHLVVQMPWAPLKEIRLPGDEDMSAEERLLVEVLEKSLDALRESVVPEQKRDDERPKLGSWQDVANYIGSRKAEIQVRTLLQHAWAAITHDRIYKSEFDVPEVLRRQLHRMAALLEEADGELQGAVDQVDTYNLNYAAYLEPEEIDAEISRWEAVLPHTKGETARGMTMKIARLATAKEDWDRVVSVLQPHAASGVADVLREIGLAESFRGNKVARQYLQHAEGAAPDDVDAHCYLGDTYCERSGTYLGGTCAEAHGHYARAFELAPSEPRALRCYVECCLCRGKDISALPLLPPGLAAAIRTCSERADIGVYVPYAYYDMGVFELMLGRPYESLSAFAKGVHHSRTPRKIERALLSVQKLQDAGQGTLRGLPSTAPEAEREKLRKWLRWCEWVRRFLLLARATKLRDVAHQFKERAGEKGAAKVRATAEAAREELCRELATKGHEPVADPVVIVAGGTDQSVEELMVEYGTLVMKAFAGFEGTIISGGTTAGICGVIGGMSTVGTVHKVSYLPYLDHLPADAPIDRRYDIREPVPLPPELVPSIAGGAVPFTALEPIQGWIDLFCQGIAPEHVTVLGINGGTIAAFEYRLALALGATVGIIQSSGRAAEEMLREADDWRTGALVWLPTDAMVLRAFVQPPAEPQEPLDEPKLLESAARTVHEKYREDKIASADPALKPWQQLDEIYKESNRQQVRYAGRILGTQRYSLRPKHSRGKAVRKFTNADEVNQMAEMEHGRWAAERLRAGWQYGPSRDKEKKTSPYLRAWADLPENVKDYDRKAVRDWPDVMKDAGLKIVR